MICVLSTIAFDSLKHFLFVYDNIISFNINIIFSRSHLTLNNNRKHVQLESDLILNCFRLSYNRNSSIYINAINRKQHLNKAKQNQRYVYVCVCVLGILADYLYKDKAVLIRCLNKSNLKRILTCAPCVLFPSRSHPRFQ